MQTFANNYYGWLAGGKECTDPGGEESLSEDSVLGWVMSERVSVVGASFLRDWILPSRPERESCNRTRHYKCSCYLVRKRVISLIMIMMTNYCNTIL